MLLKNIFNGNLQIEILLIKDDAFSSGLYILKDILSGFKSRQNDVHFFAYEKNNYFFTEPNTNLKLYDCFSSNCPWFKPSDDQRDSLCTVASSLLKNVPSNQQVCVIDSLSYPLQIDGLPKLSKTITNLSSIKFKTGVQAFPVILVLHDFEEENVEHRQVEHLANIIIAVTSDSRPERMCVSVRRKRNSGRLIVENYSCWLDSDAKLAYEEVKEVATKQIEPDDPPNMSELTTFKLTLEEKEKESRSKLVLPYMRRQQEKVGKIFYEPDANDDWDDEDPDDDLEI